MSIIYLMILLSTFTLQELGVSCNTLGDRAFSRKSCCRLHKDTDDANVKSLVNKAKPAMSMDNSKGFMGTIGILGGITEDFGSVHFIAMGALLAGADEVHIVCSNLVGPAIHATCPDFVIHPFLDSDYVRAQNVLKEVDVVILGPGLERTQHNINVVNNVLAYSKSIKQPVVIDLHDFFYTPTFLASLNNYPEPGLIMMVNSVEFEKIYEQMKRKDAFSDSQVHLDFDKIGPNMLIFRKGCTDMTFTTSPATSWSLSEGGSSRRSSGQGSVITGATAVFFKWALLTVGKNTTATSYGPMMAGSVATYAGATMMRACNRRAVSELGRTVITADMITFIDDVLYGI